MKVAIVHEWLTTYAGSERCVESFTNLYPDADIFVLFSFLDEKDRQVILKNKKTNTSFIQNLPFARKFARKYLPLFPFAVEQFDLSEYDLIISSSHAVAKGVLTTSNQLHICYSHTPIRYAWDLTHQYLKQANLTKGLKGLFAKATLHYIRMWDVSTANRPDYYIANSKYIAARIKKIYDREATVINPPVDINKFEFSDDKGNYYLTASRFVPYKRVDLIAEAFSMMPDKRLVIVGDGEDENKVRSKAGSNLEFVGYQTGDKLKEYFKKAKAFVFAAEEDFGITVIEAMACGTPVIALDKGGTAETVIDGVNGIHFNDQTALSIKEAVERFENTKNNFDHRSIAEYAKQYDRKVFEEKIKNFIDQKLKERSIKI
ncbi:MAG: glycosyltransferase family 4 protein [Ignavibacteriaceae bacterium]